MINKINQKVSIIVPVYNADKYLAETLDSLIKQTKKNWECLIIDDGSSDSSKVIAEDYCTCDERFKYFYQENAGPSVARNFGIKESSGDYIQFLDADDVILPQFLHTLTSENAELEENIILYSGILLGDDKDIYKTTQFRKNTALGKDLTFKDIYSSFGLDILFIPGCILFPKTAFTNSQWNEQLSHSEDWDLYLQISNNGFVFRNIQEPLMIYRNTPNSLSKNIGKTIISNYQILNRWKGNSLLVFSKRCSLLYKKNIFLYLTKKTDRIVNPYSSFNKSSITLCS